MHILLVNTNPVVSRLIAMKTRENADISVEEIDGKGVMPGEWYDLLFIDAECCGAKELKRHLKKIHAAKKILLTTDREGAGEGVDGMILKPFLPSEISSLLQPILESGESVREKKRVDEATALPEKRREEGGVESLVLDGEEIEKIKQLLIDEESEEQRRTIEEPKEERSGAGRDSRKKGHGSSGKKRAKRRDLERGFLEALTEMKPKKIRKLLEGAELHITIKFPEEA